MRADEKRAKKFFSAYLKAQNYDHLFIEVENDPPDYILKLGDKSVGFEVTTIEREYGEITDSTFTASTYHFVEGVIENCKKKGATGGYIIHFEEPYPNNRKIQSQIAEILENFILNTHDIEKTPEGSLIDIFQGGLFVRKLDNRNNFKVHIGWSLDKPNWAKSDGDWIATRLIEQSKHKDEKLKNSNYEENFLVIHNKTFFVRENINYIKDRFAEINFSKIKLVSVLCRSKLYFPYNQTSYLCT